MIALAQARADLDWTGFAVVIAILLILTGLAYWDAWKHDQKVNWSSTITTADPDHVDCANPDCVEVICCCRKPAECTGCTTLGCGHGEGLCWDCRLGCRECADELQAERDAAWAAGR